MAPLSLFHPLPSPGIRYNATMDERRYAPRAHLDEGGDQYTNRAVLLSSGQEHCERINFHVLVSLTPSSPTSRDRAHTGRGHRAEEVLPGETQRAQQVPGWFQAPSRPREAQPGCSVLDLGRPTLMPQTKVYWDMLSTTLRYPLRNPFFPSAQMPTLPSAGREL